MMEVKLFYFKTNLLFFAILSFGSIIGSAQTKDTSFIQYHPFMDRLPKDYMYYKTGYLESKKVIEDTSVIWSEKEYPYWRYFIANVALLAPDSILKQIWHDAYLNNPYAMCDGYSWIFEIPFQSKYLHEAPVAYFYLHNEKTYFDSLCNIVYSKYDPILINELRIIVTDDKGRSKRELTKIQASKDSINQIKIASMIKSLGKYPGKSVVGSLEDVAWLVIQHAPLEYQKKYFPFIESAVKARDLNPKYLAYSIDRINMGNNAPQIYGTQFITVDNINKLYPVKDFQNVDKLRKSVGLGPLKEYLELNEIIIK